MWIPPPNIIIISQCIELFSLDCAVLQQNTHRGKGVGGERQCAVRKIICRRSLLCRGIIAWRENCRGSNCDEVRNVIVVAYIMYTQWLSNLNLLYCRGMCAVYRRLPQWAHCRTRWRPREPLSLFVIIILHKYWHVIIICALLPLCVCARWTYYNGDTSTVANRRENTARRTI